VVALGRVARPRQYDAVVNETAQREWDALCTEHARLEAELTRLHRGGGTFDWAAHDALLRELAVHRAVLAAWREAYLPAHREADDDRERALDA
jgi:hypothetical protein